VFAGITQRYHEFPGYLCRLGWRKKMSKTDVARTIFQSWAGKKVILVSETQKLVAALAVRGLALLPQGVILGKDQGNIF